HLVGTLELLSESEQQRIIGFVINRFRGDIDILQPGIDWLEQRTGKPVLGVLPYLHDLYLESEDSMGIQSSKADKSAFNIVIPRLPRMSNHTDFDALRLNAEINLQFCRQPDATKPADLIILAGSKTVRDDLAWLKDNGWEEALLKHLRYGGKVIGICGGYQMLGKDIADPLAIEGQAGTSSGLDLLDISTTLNAEKQLKQVSGQLLMNHAPIQGYEIHAGVSVGEALSRPVLTLSNGELEGAISADGQILGTYVHGIFDSPQASAALLHWAGAKEIDAVDFNALAEQGIELMAKTVAEYLDMPLLEQLIQDFKPQIKDNYPIENQPKEAE
ncbi:MAG: cobyric acid synthase, partial [Methyloprofundus sp.]|nr:cobyric acid synthase [Methyloprofundus sp.]